MTRRAIPVAGVLALLTVLIAVGPLIAPYPPTETHGLPFGTPSRAHLLGTDFVGRDVLARVLHGGYRMTGLAALALALSYLLGVAAGLMAGMHRRLDGWLMRPVDAVIVLPWFLVIAVMATALGEGPTAIVAATALVTAPWVARVARTCTIETLSTGYVEAAQARGESPWAIAVHQILPNLRPVLIADAGIRLSATIGVVTATSFLGLGTHQPAPDWALMITENRAGIDTAPLSVLVPALLITALVVSLNMLGDRCAEPPSRLPGARSPHQPTTGGLTVTDTAGRIILDDIDLTIHAGRSIAIVGPSGAGKTTLALAILGALPTGLIQRGNAWSPAAPRPAMGYVPQDPATGLNPAMRIETHFREVQRVLGTRDTAKIEAALRDVDLPADRRFLRRFPHQLSGGQQQRVLIALTLLRRPDVLILDEPTTGLDNRTAAMLVETLLALRNTSGSTFIVITHDLAAVRDLVDDVVTIRGGRITEASPPPPVPTRARRPVPQEPSLRVDGLVAGYLGKTVVDRVSLSVAPGECVALVGRSGSGKTTLARCLVGLHRPESGHIQFRGTQLGATSAHRTLEQRAAIQLVFQNPRRSLNPRATVGQELSRPLRQLRTMSRQAATTETHRLLLLVGLDPELLHRRTPTLSGGQAQRVALARALATQPQILICDEITSSLDPHGRDGILALLASSAASGTAIVFISHDDTAVAQIADRVVRLPGVPR